MCPRRMNCSLWLVPQENCVCFFEIILQGGLSPAVIAGIVVGSLCVVGIIAYLMCSGDDKPPGEQYGGDWGDGGEDYAYS